VAEGPIYLRVAMTEIPVRHDECAVLVQELCYFAELSRLKALHVLEDALGDDDVESLVTEPYRSLKKVSLNQIWRRIMYSYIDAMVLDIRGQQAHQGCRPAPDIKEGALSTLCELIYNTRGFLQPVVRLSEFGMFFTPKIPFILPRRAVCAILMNDALT